MATGVRSLFLYAFKAGRMLSRRLFLSLALLFPMSRSLACSGERGNPLLAIRTNGSSFEKQTLSEFISKYIGHRNWFMDKDQVSGAKVANVGKPVGDFGRGPYAYVENIRVWDAVIAIPALVDGWICTKLDVLVERRFSVLASDGTQLSKEYDHLARSNVGTFQFSKEGNISELRVRLNLHAPAKIVCITRLEHVSVKYTPKTVVTTTHELIAVCGGSDYVLAPSYQFAISICDRMRLDPWAAHITPQRIESYVVQCKNNILFI